MKRLIFLLFLCPVLVYSQVPVRTENTSNKYSYHSALTTGDTLNTVKTTFETQFLVALIVGEPVASDTTIIKNGTGTVLTLVQPASAPFVFSVPINCRVDTSIVFIQKKASKSTLIYRKGY